jgi:hypothetical protein
VITTLGCYVLASAVSHLRHQVSATRIINKLLAEAESQGTSPRVMEMARLYGYRRQRLGKRYRITASNLEEG